jgi:Zn-dependent protease
VGGSLRLGRVLGIPLGVSYSWFLVLALVVLVLDSHLGDRYPFWGDAQRWATATVVALLFFACIVAHEMAHSLVAVGRGIPVKGITLFIFGGVSQISREANSPRVELSIAIVGPLLSLLLGAVFLGLAFATQNSNTTLHAGALILAYANFGLGIFNLVPGFPLDGGRVLRAGVWKITGDPWKATRVAVTAGRLAGLLLILGGLALTATSGTIWPLWLALVGWFLLQTASSSLRQARAHERLRGLRAHDVVEGDLATVPESMRLSELMESDVLPKGHLYCLVSRDGEECGLLPLLRLRRIRTSRWDEVTVGELMLPLEGLARVAPSTEALEVLDVLNEKSPDPVLVDHHGLLLGIVSKDSLGRLVSPSPHEGRRRATK